MAEQETYDTPADAAHLEYIAPGDAPPTDAGGTAAAAGPTLSGYAIVWGSTSGPRTDRTGTRRDRMLPMSAKYDAAANPVLALYNHDRKHVLGTTANGSLTLASDDVGLKFSVRLPDTTYAKDVANLVRDGYVNGVSFGMAPVKSVDKSERGQRIREFSAIDLKEITITGSPSFKASRVAHAGADAATPGRDEQALRVQSSHLAKTGIGSVVTR